MNPPLTMFGEQLSRVIKTKNGAYPVGTLVLSKAGWQSHYISNGAEGLMVNFFPRFLLNLKRKTSIYLVLVKIPKYLF